MFYYNFVNLCNKKGISPSAAAEEMGFQRSVVTRWESAKKHRDATLQRVADYFGVTKEELLKEKPSVQEDEGLSAVQQEALNFIKTLTDEQLRRFIVMGRAAFENREEP